MITYVINTSENKTFDRERNDSSRGGKSFDNGLLFELAGYNRIRWIYTDLENVGGCVEKIIVEQNKLNRDDFRVAVILDFYGFDRILPPYSRDETKVHASVYQPFLEVYLYDRLFDPIINSGYPIASCEVYYIQHKEDGSMILANQKEQEARIFSFNEKAEAYRWLTNCSNYHAVDFSEEEEQKEKEIEKETARCREVLAQKEQSFVLYISRERSLTFRALDYCGKEQESFDRFLEAIRIKTTAHGSLVRRYYNTSAGGSVNAAYDNLALSLYLVRAYEGQPKSDTVTAEDLDSTVSRMDRGALEQLLLTSYKKVHTAKEVAIGAHSNYYSLEPFRIAEEESSLAEAGDGDEEKNKKETVLKDRSHGVSFEEQYRTVSHYAAHEGGEDSPDALDEMGKLMRAFFKSRDENSMEKKEKEFGSANGGWKREVIDFPREAEYEELIAERRKKLQEKLSSALKAEFVEVDFTPEKKKADEAYEAYKSAKADMKKNLPGDIALIFFTLFAMLIPYGALQCYEAPFSVLSLTLYGIAAAFFAGIMIFSFAVHILPILSRLHRAERDMRYCYNSARQKREDSFAQLKARYQNELPAIEELRYEIRLIRRLRQENGAINKNLDTHKVMLEEVEICLKTMMNNLNIPIRGEVQESIEGEFNPEKPIISPDNKVYQVFNSDAVDALFRRKGEF